MQFLIYLFLAFLSFTVSGTVYAEGITRHNVCQ